MEIFKKNKIYALAEIYDICEKNLLITVDCLKDENLITIEEEGADCIFEFQKIKDDLFKLIWAETNPRLIYKSK